MQCYKGLPHEQLMTNGKVRSGYLSSKQVQVPGSLLQQLLVGVPVDDGQHFAVGALGKEADGAVRAAGNDTHAAPLAAELHHVQNLKGGLVAQHTKRDALIAASQELKAQLPASLH